MTCRLSLQPRLSKGNSRNFQKSYFFETYTRNRVFERFLKCRNFAITLPLSNSITDALPAVLKILGTLTVSIRGGVSLQYSYKWHIGHLKLLKRESTEDVFLGIDRNFQNKSLSEHPLKNA